MDYAERLDILEQGNVIEAKIKKLVEEVIEQLEHEYSIDWSLETSMMFVTHLAMAIKRMLEGNPLTDIPDEVKDELGKEEEIINTSMKIINNAIERTIEKFEITEEEIIFIASYVKTIKKS